MRAVVQRVSHAEVEVESTTLGQIERGLCVLVGVGETDDEQHARWLASKVVAARIFADTEDKMNLSVREVGGAVLAISQFTLFGDLRKGNRPSFSKAMEPGRAAALFETFCQACRELGVRVETGRFRAHMEVSLTNTGPVTLLLDSHKLF
jgi:D-tyrosyl-tRNA(Tyr) deacylase